MEIGQKIKSLRVEKGFNQTQLAKESGVSLPYLNQIEKGKADSVSDEILGQIAKALSVTLGELKNSVNGLKIGFSPSIWSAPILNMIISKSRTQSKISFAYYTTAETVVYFNLNERDNPDLYTVDGNMFRKSPEKQKDSATNILSEKELMDGLVAQEYDFVFSPHSYDRGPGLTSIASICSTIKGGIYAVVFPNNSNEKEWIYQKGDGLSLSDKKDKIKSEFLKDGWKRLVKNSVFHYQEESISEFIINEIVGGLEIPTKKRLAIPNENIEKTVLFMKNRWSKSSITQHVLSHDNNGGTYSMDRFGEMFNTTSWYNLIDIEKKQDDNYNIYIGWEPYISRLINEYEGTYPNSVCISFDINEFLNESDTSYYLDYECFIKSDRLDSIKKSEDVKNFFLELDSTIKRLENLSQSKSISPEIGIISELLHMQPKVVVALIKQIKFSLKFYPNWSL